MTQNERDGETEQLSSVDAANLHQSPGFAQIHAQPYDWPHDKSFDPRTTALLVIDMQRDFLEEGGYLTLQGYSPLTFRSIIPAILDLLRSFEARHFPIYFTRESHRPDLSTLSARENWRSRNNKSGLGIGSETPALGRALLRGELGCSVIPELLPFCHDDVFCSNVVDKPGRSAFAHTELELMLRNKGVRNLAICGVTTDVCVHSTMREANDRGFDCLLIEDACAAGDENLHRWAIESVKGEGGIFGSVSTVRDVVSALKSKGL